ncbi:MAG: SDR family NAD(P)-dependent oxidoreductase [Cellvibrionaceae bacterium]|nr:SDR family NAD(P)-dependent oxidoreductase [Cellvibrionaceae bacterium]
MTTQKTALVTGAGSGIGKAVATDLARAGHKVLVTDLNPAAAEAVAASLRQEGVGGGEL